VQDPQALDPALFTAAEIAWRSGNLARADVLLDEFASANRVPPGFSLVSAAFLLHAVGRPVPFELGEAVPTPWIETARAIRKGDLVSAAEILQRVGARAVEAGVRLQAAQEAAEQGRRAEVEGQLSRALAFYREVGASAYVRAAEALLPAAS
jgi:hypothetical protein